MGNPGSEYTRNRHNVGFMVVDFLARESDLQHWNEEGLALVGRCTISGKPLILAKPLTYMNLSGRAALELLARYALPLESVVVVLDDVNLPFGKIRVRSGGSAGGHHGLESILDSVGSEEIARVRLGIGEENVPPDLSEFVLSDFPPEAETPVKEMVSRAGDAVRNILEEGISQAMSNYNSMMQ